MTYSLESINCVKNNWYHKWFDASSDYRIRECVKGPFVTPKIVVSIPYMTKDRASVSTKHIPCHCKKQTEEENEEVYSKPGIPDPWEEYLILNSFDEKGKRKFDDYHKIDFDIIKRINDPYLLYFGQGIPDPWKKWLHFESLSEDASDLKKDIKTYISKLRSGPGSEMIETEEICCPACNNEFSTLFVNHSKEFDKCDNAKNRGKYKIVTVIPMHLGAKNNRIPNEKASLRDACIGTESVIAETRKFKDIETCQLEKDKNCYCHNKNYATCPVCDAIKDRKSKADVNENVRDEKIINMILNNETANFQHHKTLPLLSQTNKHDRKAHRSNHFLSCHSSSLDNSSCTSSAHRLTNYCLLKSCSCHCKVLPQGVHLQSALPFFCNILAPCLCSTHHLIGFERKPRDHSLGLKLVCPKCEEKRKTKRKRSLRKDRVDLLDNANIYYCGK